MAVDVKQWLDDVLKAAGADDSKRQAVLDVFGNETVSKRVANEIMMQSDYNRNMDQLRTQTQAFDGEKQKWQDWYAKALITTQSNQKAVEELNAKVARYESEYGDLGGGTNGRGNGDGSQLIHAVGDVVTKKDLEEALSKQGGYTLSVLKDAVKVSHDYMHRFHEPLDVDALQKLAVERNLPLAQAYQEMIAPKVAEAQKADMDAKLAAAREEGAKEFASKHKIPVDVKPREYHPIFDRAANTTAPTGPLAERQRMESFVDTWNNAQRTNTSGGS